VALIVPSLGDDTVSTPAVGTFVRSLAERLDLSVYPMRYPLEPGPLLQPGLAGEAVGGRLRLRHRLRRVLSLLRTAHRAEPFDLVHGIWLFEPGLVAALAGQLLGIPSVASVGGVEVARLTDIRVGGLLDRRARYLNQAALRWATLVTGGSTDVLRRARAAVPGRRQRFALLPLPVDTTLFSNDLPATDNHGTAPRLFHAASLIPVKDQVTLLRAFAVIRDARPDARLEIAGEDPFGYRSSLETAARGLGIADAVRFLGQVPVGDLPDHYRTSDLFLFSSRYESQGMVVLEAAACGLPTVGTAVGVVADLAPKAAVAVPPGDYAGLAREALRLLDDPGERGRIATLAGERVRSFYSEEAVANRAIEIYGRLIEGR
jgi:glycosyltransferase involved in cell wall biosynthesis